jgi:hypothetical protein
LRIVARFDDHHSTLCRTLRCVPDIGFFTTIQNMIDVAKLKAYLLTISLKPGVAVLGGLTM